MQRPNIKKKGDLRKEDDRELRSMEGPETFCFCALRTTGTDAEWSPPAERCLERPPR